jgi:hypothetical protein
MRPINYTAIYSRTDAFSVLPSSMKELEQNVVCFWEFWEYPTHGS